MALLRKILRASTLCFSSLIVPGLSMQAHTEYWEQRVSLFDQLPVTEGDIVFLGNSITDGGEFAELFSNPAIKNRGINGDVISGVRERLHQVTDGKPSKIFLLIGINDISHSIPSNDLAKEYEALVGEITKNSPSTRLYIQSVMPINNDFGRYKNLKGKEQTVIDLNELIKAIAQNNGAVFIDLSDVLASPDGKLRREFTNDGLHLTGEGYKAWTDHIKHFIEE